MGDDLKFKLKLKCFFCFSDQFMIPHENYIPKYGDIIVCGNCGKKNDVTSLLKVVNKKAENIMKKVANEKIKELFKKLK